MFQASSSLFNTLKKAWDHAPFVQRADSAMFLFITKIMKVIEQLGIRWFA